MIIYIFFKFCLFFVIFCTIKQHEVYCQLTSETASEGDCINPKVFTEANVVWVNTPRIYYATMGSQHLYRAYAEYLLGRSVKDQAELNKMNLRIKWIGTLVTTTGFGERFGQLCYSATPNIDLDLTSNIMYNAKCVATYGTSKTDLSRIDETHDILVWTDNKNALLITRCIHNQRDFKVLTVNKTIPEDVKLLVLEKIKVLGFDPSKVEYLPYETSEENSENGDQGIIRIVDSDNDKKSKKDVSIIAKMT